MDLTLHPDVVVADTEYGCVLLDEQGGEYWSLNPTGALVLRALLDGGDVADAADALVAEHRLDRRAAAEDVRALVAQLRAAGLVLA